MIGLATGRYDVLRGSTTNEYGDEVDSTEFVYRGLLGSVLEQSRRVFLPAESRSEVVRFITGRFNCAQDIQNGDRIYDSKKNLTYVVQSVNFGNSPVHRSDVVCDLILN